MSNTRRPVTLLTLKLPILLLATLFLNAMAATAQAGADDIIQQGRELTTAFYAGDVDTVWSRFDAQMKQAMGNVDQLAAFHSQVSQQLGEETRVVDETTSTVQGHQLYQREVNFANSGDASFIVQWAFNADGAVSGFFIRPKQPQAAIPPDPNADYETQAKLQLPFEGDWTVFWGGVTLEDNYHIRSRDQRYAYDLLVQRDGKRHSGDGTNNADYYCWGKPVLAPADGRIVKTVDGLPDMTPGRMDPQNPAGNHVVIDHGNEEYSFLAHFRENSIRVREGDRVTAGQQLGACGNSGNTSEPHLHYHLQDTPLFGNGNGLPARFNHYVANGELVERGIPVKGQTISNARKDKDSSE